MRRSDKGLRIGRTPKGKIKKRDTADCPLLDHPCHRAVQPFFHENARDIGRYTEAEIDAAARFQLLRYATRDAFFCIQEINIGMMADVGTMNRVPKQLPEGVVRELAYTGDRLGAERAERLGWVNGLFEGHQALVDGVLAVARKIAAKPPRAIAATKEMISYARDHSVAESFAYLNALQPGVFSVEDILKSVSAPKEGPPAEFDDLTPVKPPIG